MSKPNIVILGAGYGGMITAVRLQKTIKPSEATITLVNRNDYHYQTTWLHENAAGTLSHERTKIPIDDVIDRDKVHIVLEKVVGIKPKEKKVKLEKSELSYDILVVGLGFEAATFGVQGLARHAFTIEDLNSARLLNQNLEYHFAAYHHGKKADPSRLNIVVGGGGFTGIEFLGELANRIPALCEKFDIEKTLVRIVNIEKSPMVLSGFDPQLAEYAMNSLEARGVEFITGAAITACEPDHMVYEKDGKEVEIPTRTTVWAAGVKANGVIEQSGLATNRGKVEVREDLRSPDYDDIFVIGDCATVVDEATGNPYPPTAQIAIQQAKTAAGNIKSLITSGKQEKFQPKILGTVASLGHNDAIGELFGSRKIRGLNAVILKKIIDNRYLWQLGGIRLLLRKGKFNIFY